MVSLLCDGSRETGNHSSWMSIKNRRSTARLSVDLRCRHPRSQAVRLLRPSGWLGLSLRCLRLNLEEDPDPAPLLGAVPGGHRQPQAFPERFQRHPVGEPGHTFASASQVKACFCPMPSQRVTATTSAEVRAVISTVPPGIVRVSAAGWKSKVK